MQRTVLLSKLHNCTLTGANLEYVGSISIDATLLTAAHILPYEQVQVVNVSNGERLITYAIAAPPDSGCVELNGAAARLGARGDRVIIMTYAQMTPQELATHQPTVVLVTADNQIAEVRQSGVKDAKNFCIT
ncbi:aspartate 1-decarboxylase [Synechococcales cyanobacterium C]|uniref:Aspartate 1-decarboxylase n=1 Tax=Petrachloros mirabilis ULC683 TaxID=2781853 RepID=A0A8K2A172_9CYAN|nr:aspartate 1-decarboxylase [Petrachloros mirabilis]NCJ07933.1 aspartate 1-decarboxylase [Petrachloros mirabilis ULC683]